MKNYYSPRVLNAMKCKAKGSHNCGQGHKHDSCLEAKHCDILHLMQRSTGSDIAQIERQKQFNLMVNGQKICGHQPDFLITRKDGTQYIVESKGFFKPEWDIKRKLTIALYPDITYEVWTK